MFASFRNKSTNTGKHKIEAFERNPPNTVENGAISVYVEQPVWNRNDVKMSLFLVWEIRVGNPDVPHHSLIKLKVAEITEVFIIQARIYPCLSKERLH